MELLPQGLGIAVIVALVLWLWFWVPYNMATRRRRSAATYVFLTVLLSPLITVPILFVIGSVPRHQVQTS